MVNGSVLGEVNFELKQSELYTRKNAQPVQQLVPGCQKSSQQCCAAPCQHGLFTFTPVRKMLFTVDK